MPFLVLAGNAIATLSSDDLALLSSVMGVLDPVAKYPSTRKMRDACARFYEVATIVVSSTSQAPAPWDANNWPVTMGSNAGMVADMNAPYGFPMSHQSWDTAMVGFETELGDSDFRALADVIEPYYVGHLNWQADFL